MTRRLQIGMWNELREEDWERYGNSLIQGLELCQYADREALDKVVTFCREHRLSYGIHAPALRSESDKLLPRLTSLMEDERKEAQKRVIHDVEEASRVGADYLLLHYPFPPLLSSSFEPREIGRMPKFFYYQSEEWTSAQFEQTSDELFNFLAELQHKSGQRIILEYDFFGDYEEQVVAAFRRYPELSLVIDTQRMSVHNRIFPAFDPYAWLTAVAPSVYLAHYSNIKTAGPGYLRHLPVLPEQAGDPAYGDAEQYLLHLAKYNSRFHVTLEHDPSLVSREQLLALYASVSGLLCQPGIVS